MGGFVWTIYENYEICEEVGIKKKICAELKVSLKEKLDAVAKMQSQLDVVIANVD